MSSGIKFQKFKIVHLDLLKQLNERAALANEENLENLLKLRRDYDQVVASNLSPDHKLRQLGWIIFSLSKEQNVHQRNLNQVGQQPALPTSTEVVAAVTEQPSLAQASTQPPGPLAPAFSPILMSTPVQPSLLPQQQQQQQQMQPQVADVQAQMDMSGESPREGENTIRGEFYVTYFS